MWFNHITAVKQYSAHEYEIPEETASPAFQIKQHLEIYSFTPHFVLAYTINMSTESNVTLKISEKESGSILL